MFKGDNTKIWCRFVRPNVDIKNDYKYREMGSLMWSPLSQMTYLIYALSD